MSTDLSGKVYTLSNSNAAMIVSTFIHFFLLSLSAAIELRIDRRCTLAELKTRLEEYVHVLSSEFKVRLKRAYPGHYCSSVHARSSFVPYCRKFLPFLLPALMGKFLSCEFFYPVLHYRNLCRS